MHSLQVSLLIAAVLPATNVLAVLLPRADQCGVRGWDTNTESYYYEDSGKYAGYAKCSAHCAKDSKCQSFAHDDKNICMHFNVTVTGNFESDTSSSFLFYDRGCISSASTTGTTTTTIGTQKQSITTTKGITTSTVSKSTIKSSTTDAIASSKTASSSTTGTTTSSKVSTASTTKPMVSSGSSSSSTAASSTKVISSSTTTVKSQTTTKAVTTLATTTTGTKSASSSSASSTAVALPSGCNIPTSYTVTNFSWFNSTHNLDCVNGPDVGDGTGCIKSSADGQTTVWCDPKTDKDCTNCGIAVCSTGLPPQPIGYGPPDDVKFTLSDGTACEQLNPAVVHRFPVGDGFVNCGGTYDFMNFYGSSNAASQTGNVVINSYPTQCSDGQTIVGYYSAQFQVDCTHDKQNNATCTTPHGFTIPLISYSKSQY